VAPEMQLDLNARPLIAAGRTAGSRRHPDVCERLMAHKGRLQSQGKLRIVWYKNSNGVRCDKSTKIDLDIARLVALLIVVAVGSVATYLLVAPGRPGGTSWQDPVTGIAPDKIVPEIASILWQAHPLWIRSTRLSITISPTPPMHVDPGSRHLRCPRIGRLLELAGQFQQVGDVAMARLIYQQVYDLAVLSPALSDPLRAEALLSVGKGWASLEQDDQAMTAYDQSHAIAWAARNLQTRTGASYWRAWPSPAVRWPHEDARQCGRSWPAWTSGPIRSPGDCGGSDSGS